MKTKFTKYQLVLCFGLTHCYLPAAFSFLFLMTMYSGTVLAQTAPAIQGQGSLGGTSFDQAESIQQTRDGGFIVAGYSLSNNGNVIGNHGDYDYWIVKSRANGKIQWQKCLGGSSADYASCIQQTKDGGYIVAGYSSSNDGDVSGNHGGLDYWVVKLDTAGNIQWQKSLGGTSHDNASSIQQTKDSGYIVAGYTVSNDGDVSGNHGNGNGDYWIVKLDTTGNIQWQKCLGGTSTDVANSIQQTKDGGYIVAGYTYSNDGDVRYNNGNGDYWIVKLNSLGSIQWQKCLGGTSGDGAHSIQQTKDGGYIVAGNTSSNDGEVSGNHGGSDYWIVKLDITGNIQWQKCLGGTSYDDASSIQQTKDSGYIVAGQTQSNDGDVSGDHGKGDYWVVKLDAVGSFQWQECLGGTSYDYAYSIQQTKDGGYIVAGEAQSNDGNVSGHHGSTANPDYWIVKLDASGVPVLSQSSFTIANTEKNKNTSILRIQPNPVQSYLHIEGLNTNEHYELKIINTAGSIVEQLVIKNVSSYSINVSKLATGVYYLTAGQEKLKFVKQ